METCEHVEGLQMSPDSSILDPSKWSCTQCGNTEWVWACFSCQNVACGRLNDQHALEHFEQSKHPVAIEVNQKYVYCYICDQYIIGDSKTEVLEMVRNALEAIGTLSLEELQQSTGKLLKSYSQTQEFSWSQDDANDRLVTADLHYRKTILRKLLSLWQDFVRRRKNKEKIKNNQCMHTVPPILTRAQSGHFHLRKKTFTPGVTGLRNLGNTCYINSIIQALGHLDEFREYFSHLMFGLLSPTGTPLPAASPPTNTGRALLRLNTIDYFQHISTKGKSLTNMNNVTSTVKNQFSPQKIKAGGLNGGSNNSVTKNLKLQLAGLELRREEELRAKLKVLQTLSLCQELHGLLRVLWSGKWAQVSPHGFLHSLWKAIPSFKGHSQHDAQEFLCELLDKVSQEIEHLPQLKGCENIVDQSFRGELVSQVTCLECANVSSRRDAFLDLSLEFPHCFQSTNTQNARGMCHVTEMLSTFTAEEYLEPKTYSCEKCNAQRRRQSRTPFKTSASKRLLIAQAPDILRLHLKRFRWSGRNHREKIGTHVIFEEQLDISPFCAPGQDVCGYRLNAVVVHHGAGFRAGHYTVYTYNTQADSWLHCNDSQIQLVSVEDVLACQAYILFFTRQSIEVKLDDMPVLTPMTAEESTDTMSSSSTLPDLDPQTLSHLRKGDTLQALDDEVSFSFHRDQKLVKRISSSHKLDVGRRKRPLSPTEEGQEDSEPTSSKRKESS